MKRILLAMAAVILVGSPLLSGMSGAGNNVVTKSGKMNSASLRDMLTKGLKATREEEKLYIDYVVNLVAMEKLPISYVYACFDYARKRRPDYPFPYFHYSLKTLGKRKNLDL